MKRLLALVVLLLAAMAVFSGCRPWSPLPNGAVRDGCGRAPEALSSPQAEREYENRFRVF